MPDLPLKLWPKYIYIKMINICTNLFVSITELRISQCLWRDFIIQLEMHVFEVVHISVSESSWFKK